MEEWKLSFGVVICNLILNAYIGIYTSDHVILCDAVCKFIIRVKIKYNIMQPMVTREELLKVPFSRMKLDPDNERIDLGPIEWLIDNIRNEGVKEPLWGYKGIDQTRKECYFVVNGSRRFEALKVIYDEGRGIEIVAPFKTFNPVKVNSEQRIVERLIRNEGLPYSRLEKSSSIGKLSAYGWSHHKIAEQLSMSHTWVSDTLLLHHAPQRLKNIIAAKGIQVRDVGDRDDQKGRSGGVSGPIC